MEAAAISTGPTVDILLSGDEYDLQFSGEAAWHLREMIEEALGLDLLDSEPQVIRDAALKERIIAEALRHIPST
jgi:hypothetical protein